MAFRLIAYCRLLLKYTLQFPFAEIDPDGILILDLRTAIANPTSVAWVKKREAAKPKVDVAAINAEPKSATAESGDYQLLEI